MMEREIQGGRYERMVERAHETFMGLIFLEKLR